MSDSVSVPIRVPIYGLNQREDQDDLPPGYTRGMVNMERRGLAVVKAKGKLKINTSAALGGSVVQGGWDFQAPGGVRLEIIHGQGKVSKMVGLTETALESNMDIGAVIRGTVFMGQLFYTNGFDVVRFTDGNSSSLLPPAPMGRLIHLYNDHLFIANVPNDTNGPSILYNSDLRDPTTWGAANVYNVDTNNAEEITALFTLRGYLGVAKNDSITYLRGNFFDSLSDSYDAIRFPTDTGMGIVAQGTCVEDEMGSLLFLNESGFYRLQSPNSQPKRLSGAINGLISSINFSVAHLFTAVRYESIKEIWWCVAVNGSATPNLILRYNYLYMTPEGVGSWWPLNLANVRSVWSYESGQDLQQIRGGDNAGFTYNLNQGYADGGNNYNAHVILDNIRSQTGGYCLWDWLIGRYDNAGSWSVNMEVYPGGIRNAPHVVTVSESMTDDP